MFKTLALAAFVLLIAGNAPSVQAQQSLQSLHARVPAPPANAAAAPAWLTSAEVATLRKQLKDQRAFVDKLSADANSQSVAGASNGPIDYARAQRDPAYAQQLQEKFAKMTQAEQMALAMEMQKATQAQAIRDVQTMAADPEAVTAATERWPDYQTRQMTGGGITAQQTAVANLQRAAQDKAFQIGERTDKKMKCSDGEGSCSAADQAADKAVLRAAYAEIVAEYDRALVQIAQHVTAARKARAADIAAAQKDLAPALYGSAAKSTANKQLMAAYHNAVLMEVEQLFELSEHSAQWAANRAKDRTINLKPID